jgi:polysaccharide export outer membrane protein
VLADRPNAPVFFRNVKFGYIRACLAAFLAIALCACSPQAVTTITSPRRTVDPKPYVIGPDDVLDVIVWKQDQLSGQMPVEEDGTISVPLAGRVRAAGLTCQMLQKELHDKLAAFTDNPQVTVRVAQPLSKVFYVVGEVNKPGAIQLRAGEVLSQGLAEAGGLTEFADRRAIKIIRRTPTENITMTIDYKKVEQGDLAADVSLEPGDTIMVR